MLCTGAGLSIAEPAAGPRGSEVAEALRPFVAELLGATIEELADHDLENLAVRVAEQAADQMGQFRTRAAAAADFCGMEPNYGHEAVALLMREGLVKTVSVNWDLGIENAGTRLDIKIVGVSTALERSALSQELPLYKVHGCASRPSSLKVTRHEVDEPMKWARAEVQQALAGGTVIFIGLGTVGSYVTEPLEDLLPLWRAEGATIRVVDPGGLSAAWRKALTEGADGVHIDAGADDFLDDLLRAVAREALSQAAERIRAIHDGAAPWTQTMLDGIQHLRVALAEVTADAVFRWLRDGVTRTTNGQPFILVHAGQQSLMALALLAGADGQVEVEQRGQDLTVRTPRQYLEIASRPGESFRNVERAARDRIRRRREQGLYTAGGGVAVAVHGTAGPFPHFEAPADIAASEDERFDVAAGIEDNVRLLRAERAVSGEALA